MFSLIAPHGGRFVNRFLEGSDRERVSELIPRLKKVVLKDWEISDLYMIASGGFSPIEGFMCKEDYHSVIDNMRLKDGTVWTIPVTLSVSADEAKKIKDGESVGLFDKGGDALGILEVEEKFSNNREKEASGVYGTQDKCHPGVLRLYEKGDVLLGGRVSVINRPKYDDFKEYRLDPIDTRRLFKEKGWKRIVGFQTRNPIHRAHEYIQKCTLEMADGLLIHPLIGETKKDDIPADIRMECYKTLIENYYPNDRVVLSVFPAAMRYAGPREAVFHALVRKNYGCTHFIVGRDHAGVGNFYGSFDAHYIFDEFNPEEIGITPMFFDYTFFCKQCGCMASYKTCPHDAEDHISLSGTKVREMLRAGKTPPKEFSRPEVANVLIESYKSKS